MTDQNDQPGATSDPRTGRTVVDTERRSVTGSRLALLQPGNTPAPPELAQLNRFNRVSQDEVERIRL
ncbi:hypothetical protein [Azospirillum largimobile]